MSRKAPRPRWPVWRPTARGACQALALVVALLVPMTAGATPPDIITAARFAEPTTRYAHGVLGDDVEWGALVLSVDKCPDCAGRQVVEVTIRLPRERVFEDLQPRLFVDEEGATAVAVVESHRDFGARLAVYDETGLRAATPWIGRANRWLAPFPPADLDGDGRIELAYIDRPHLAKTLRVWRLDGNELTEVARLAGFTNHRIGWDYITGGVRDCGTGPEIVTATGNWQRMAALRLEGRRLTARDLGRWSRETEARALECR